MHNNISVSAADIASRLNASGFKFRGCVAFAREEPGFIPSLSWKESDKTFVKACVLRKDDGTFTNKLSDITQRHIQAETRATAALVLKVNKTYQELIDERSNATHAPVHK